MARGCDGEIAAGIICAQCGREHRYFFTGKRIVIACALIALAVGGVIWYFNSAAVDNWQYDRNKGRYKVNAHGGGTDEDTGEYRPRRIARYEREPSW